MPIGFILNIMQKRIVELSQIFIILLFVLVLVLFLQLFYVCGSPVAYKDFNGYPPGARSHSMGSVGIALLDNPFASFYNPAALCFLKTSYFVFDFQISRSKTHTQENQSTLPGLSGVGINCISTVNPSGGVTWRPLSRKKEEKKTLVFSVELQETLSIESKLEYSTDEFYLTLTTLTGTQIDDITEKPLLGINLKYYRAILAESEVKKTKTTPVDASSNFDTGNGFGIDLGFSYMKNPILLGITINDIFSKVYWTDYDNDRIHTKTGAGITTFFLDQWAISTDLRYDGGLKKTGVYTGTEYRIGKIKKEEKKLLFGQPKNEDKSLWAAIFRIGARLDNVKRKKEIIYSLGFGYSLSQFNFDIAFSGDKELVKSKSFSSQISILVIY